MRTRSKLIIASIIILVSSIIIALIVQYIVKERQEKNLENSLNQVSEQGFLGTSDTNQFQTIVEETVQYPFFDAENIELYYFNYSAGKFYKSNLNTRKSLAILPYISFESDLSNAQWNQNFTKVLAINNIEGNKKIYDLEKNSAVDLENNYISFLWLAENQLIVNYHNFETKENSIVLLDQDGKITEKILDLQPTEEPYGINFIGSNNEKVYYIFNLNTGYSYLYELNVSTKSNSQLEEKNIINAKISPNKQKIIYSTLENDQQIYFLFDTTSHENKQLAIDANMENIVFSNDSSYLYLVIGNPGNEEGSGAYSYNFIDKIDKYNLTDNNQSTIIEIAEKEKYAGSNYFLNSDESLLYFINAANSYLYSINLK